MILQKLMKKPDNNALKRTSISSFLLFLICAILVVYFLELSHLGGTVAELQLGFNDQYVRNLFAPLSSDQKKLVIIANIFDYCFMIGYGSFLFSICLIFSRKFNENSLWRKVGSYFAIFGIIVAISDGCENIFLFQMISNPTQFPSWFAIGHSIFASVKFILMLGCVIFVLLIISVFKINSIKQNSKHI